MFDLPVLEDADSIQIPLGQIMRMIVCRQVDTNSAGLLLYALQIASANLPRTRFEPYHKDVTVDLFRVPERVIGAEAWSPSTFKDANVGNVGRAPSPAEPSPAKDARVARTPLPAKESCVVATLPEPQPEPPPLAVPLSAKETHVARTPSSAKESCVVATLPEPQPDPPPLAVPLSAKETHVARTPSSAKESCAAPTPPEPQPKAPSPATQPAPASNVPTSSLPSATEQHDLQKAERAMAGALKGDWRDVKTLFEFAGIFPPKDNTPATDP